MNIGNRLLGYFLVIALFVIAAMSLEDNKHHDEPNSESDKSIIEAVLKSKIDSIKIFENSFNDCLKESVLNNRTANNYFQKKTLPVGGSVFVFANNDVLFWSDNKCPIDSINYKSLIDARINRIGNGYYFINKSKEISKERQIIYCLFIRYDFNIQNQYLENNYNSNLQLCSHHAFSISPQPNTSPINYDGKPLFYISRVDSNDAHNKSVIVFILYLFAYLLLNVALIDLTFVLGKRNGFAGVLSVVALFAVRYLMIIYTFPKAFYNTEFFSPKYYASSSLLNSPLDLFFGVLCLLALMVYLYSLVIKEKTISFISKWNIVKISFLFILLLICFSYSYVINFLLNGLILSSQISFNFNNIFELDLYSLIGLFVIGIVFSGFYFITIATTYFIRQSKLSLQIVFINLIITALVFGFLNYASVLFSFSEVYSYYSYLFSFLLLLFIFYTRVFLAKGYRQEGIILIVLGFSIYATYQIYSFNQIKESEKQRSFANKIHSEKDNIADYFFDEIRNKIKTDNTIIPLLATSGNFEDVNKYLLNKYFSDYFSNYDIAFYYLDENSQCLNKISEESFDEIKKEYLIQNTGLLNYSGKLEKQKQYGVVDFPLNNNVSCCVIEFSNKRGNNIGGFPDLLVSSSVIANQNNSDYSFARYKNGKLNTQSGTFNYYITSAPYEEDIKKSDAFYNNGYYHIIIKDNNGLTIISRKQKSLLEIITLFSYLFAFFSLSYLLGYITYHFYHNDFSISTSYNNRIKFTVVTFVICTLIISGVTTIIYIISNNSESEQLKSQQTIKDLNNYLENTFEDATSIERLTTQEASELNKLNKTIHTDFSIYNPKGYLVYSTQPRIFDQELISPLMNKTAFLNLKNLKLSGYYQTENIGKLEYRASYRPIYNRKGEQCAYLNINYFFTEKQVKAEISKFLIALINLYVFLFTISILIAVFISNKITAPLKFIQESFKKTRLNAKNNLISWDKKDEIGALVNEYNRMLMALQKSAEELAKSERESAWREMAKQVAHEIKNPLTPMKLGIQHMLRVIESSQDNREEIIKKISSGLIEQIDNLSNIASAFSDFAKMPQAEYEEINIRELIKNTIVLFKQSENIKIENNTNAVLPTIIGDKNQIIRILNNLFRNAIQSMEDIEGGLIKIEAKTINEFLVVSISDNGKGIPADLQEKIFVPYFTTKSSGTGLGLAIVKNMMLGMQGNIRFESIENKGTTFHLYFKVA
jgi:signal transduction histidine kinase